MGLSSLLLRFTCTAVFGLIVKFTDFSGIPSATVHHFGVPPQAGIAVTEPIDTAAAKKLICKTGFKAGKTPVSLAAGGKPGCVDTKLAATGKKLFTAPGHPCFACHALIALYPVSQTNSNLRAQGFTLKPASIQAAFALHSDLMLGASITAKDAKAISAYLQTIK